ncbi:hypothetical protein FACS189440_18350 [Bacteroidia bacterium]|nr:hypothetical protein FACS189440_18350 [Bacteroidia bacterium]
MTETLELETKSSRLAAFLREEELRNPIPPEGYMTSNEFNRRATDMIKRKFGML